MPLADFARLDGITEDGVAETWPPEVDAGLDAAIRAVVEKQGSRYGDAWHRLGWGLATDSFRRRAWALAGKEVVQRLSEAFSPHPLPVVVDGGLGLRVGGEVLRHEVIPPTEAGWSRLLALAPDSKLSFKVLTRVAWRWWGRRFPRGHLSRATAQAA